VGASGGRCGHGGRHGRRHVDAFACRSARDLVSDWRRLIAGADPRRPAAPSRRSAHEEDRPALFAAQFALSHACWLVTYLVAGVVGNEIGLFWTFGLLGLLVVVSTGLAVRLWPSADPDVLEHEHAPLQHEHLHTHDEHHQHPHEGLEDPEPHRHAPLRHRHAYVIDYHHAYWPKV
jgi:hypothetical protein